MNLPKARIMNSRILLRSDKYIGGWNASDVPLLEGEAGFTIRNEDGYKRGIIRIGPGSNIDSEVSTQPQTWDQIDRDESNPRYHQYTFYSGRGAGYVLEPASSNSLGGIKVDPSYSNGIYMEDDYLRFDPGNIMGDEFSFACTGNNTNIFIDENGIGLNGEVFIRDGLLQTSDILNHGRITTDELFATTIVSQDAFGGDYIVVRWGQDVAEDETTSGLRSKNLFEGAVDGLIQLNKDDGSLWAGPENALQRVPYISTTEVADPQNNGIYYDFHTKCLQIADTKVKVSFYSDHSKTMPPTITTANLEEYEKTYPAQELSFRVPTLLTDFSDLADHGVVSTTEKAKWDKAVQGVIEDTSIPSPAIDRSGEYEANPTIRMPHIPLPSEYVPSTRTINGRPLTDDITFDTGTTYTAGNSGISINATNSTISHYEPDIIAHYEGTFPLFNGESFTVVESISLDDFGHVTQITSKTYKVAVGGASELFITPYITSFTIKDDEDIIIPVVTKPNATVSVVGATGICSATVTSSDLATGIHEITCVGLTHMRAGTGSVTITAREGATTKTATISVTGDPIDPLTITNISPSSIWGNSTNNQGGRVAVTFNRIPTGHTVSPYTNSDLYYIDGTSLSGNIIYVDVKFQPTPTNGSATVTVTGTLGYQTASRTFTVFYDSNIEPW